MIEFLLLASRVQVLSLGKRLGMICFPVRLLQALVSLWRLITLCLVLSFRLKRNKRMFFHWYDRLIKASAYWSSLESCLDIRLISLELNMAIQHNAVYSGFSFMCGCQQVCFALCKCSLLPHLKSHSGLLGARYSVELTKRVDSGMRTCK